MNGDATAPGLPARLQYPGIRLPAYRVLLAKYRLQPLKHGLDSVFSRFLSDRILVLVGKLPKPGLG